MAGRLLSSAWITALLVSAGILAASSAHAADKDVSGIITTTTWTADTTYHVTGAAAVLPANTLTVEPGTNIEFDADVPFIVAGTLNSQGTAAQGVTFRNGDSTWTGMRVLGSATLQYTTLTGAHGNGENPDSVAAQFEGILEFLKNLGSEIPARPAVDIPDLPFDLPVLNIPDLSDVDWSVVNIDSIAPYTGLGVLSVTGPQASLSMTGGGLTANTAEGIGGVVVAAGAHADFSEMNYSNNTAGATGGVKYLVKATGSLSNTTVADNQSALGLGGVLVQRCNDITIQDCSISGNTLGEKLGGALVLADSGSVLVTGTEISGNTADSPGGGVLAVGQVNVTLANCTVANNTAKGLAAGVGIAVGPIVTMTDCEISGNTVSSDPDAIGFDLPIDVDAVGGGMLVTDANLVMRRCTIANNAAGPLTGGAMTILTTGVFNTIADLKYCVLSGNEGGAITALGAIQDSSDATTTLNMTNCTVADNTNSTLDLFAGVGAFMEAEVNILNCILWDGTYATVGRPMILNEIPSSFLPDGTDPVPAGIVTATYSDIMVAVMLFSSPYQGEGNIKLNPRFGTNYTLTSESPCINSGSPASPREEDGSIADMGAKTTSPSVSVEQDRGPASLVLDQNVPNPFNPHTAISFSTLTPGRARLTVYNMQGQLVAVLADGQMQVGVHTFAWNGRDLNGAPAASGAYLYRLTCQDGTGRKSLVRRMLLVR